MVDQYVYPKFEWIDHILEMDENGDYVIDPLKGQPKILQQGTYHSAFNDNNQEQGIAKSHQRLDSHDNDLMRMKVQMELDGRAPGNSGTFADTFDGEPNKLVRQIAVAVLTAPRAAGTTVLNVDTTDGFKAFTEVTIYDGTNSEDVLITDITLSTITVQPLVNDYVKGARVARSNARIADGQMVNGNWGTYAIEVMEVV